jgi:hypothetical protein
VDAIGKSFLIEGNEDPKVSESGTEEIVERCWQLKSNQ